MKDKIQILIKAVLDNQLETITGGILQKDTTQCRYCNELFLKDGITHKNDCPVIIAIDTQLDSILTRKSTMHGIVYYGCEECENIHTDKSKFTHKDTCPHMT